MIESDIFKNLDNCNMMEFRYLMYLSRNNAWVNVVGELYKITIHCVIETIHRPIGKTIYYDKKYHSVSNQDDFSLKLLFSKRATSLALFGKHTSANAIEASEHLSLPGLKLNAVSHELTNLTIWMDDLSISLKVGVENYDYQFINNLTTSWKFPMFNPNLIIF